MALPEMTELQKKMYEACGHNVEIHLTRGYKPVIGKCINYTSPLDNDPEVASMDIAVPSQYHENGRRIVEIIEDEIETLAVLDEED